MPTEVKHVSVVLAGSGEQHPDVEIQRGVTVRDLKEQLRLTGYMSKLDDPTPLGETEELFSRVHDGEKLLVGPKTSVATRRNP